MNSARWIIKTVHLHRRHVQVQCCTRNPQLDLEEEVVVAFVLFRLLQDPPSRYSSHHLLQLQVVVVCRLTIILPLSMDHQQDDGASSVRSYSSGNTRERPTAASSTANRRIHSYSYSV